MKTLLSTTLILLACTGCMHIQQTAGNDGRQFVGYWRSFEGPGAIRASSDLTVFEDGRFQMFVQIVVSETFRHELGGTWHVQDGELLLRADVSDSEEIFPLVMTACLKRCKLSLRDPLGDPGAIVYQKSTR